MGMGPALEQGCQEGVLQIVQGRFGEISLTREETLKKLCFEMLSPSFPELRIRIKYKSDSLPRIYPSIM